MLATINAGRSRSPDGAADPPGSDLRGGLEVDYELCAFARAGAEGVDGSMVHFYDCPADRQPQPQTFPARPDLLERVKNFVEMFRFDADAGIADLDLQRGGFRINGANDDRAALRGKFRSVLQHVPKYLLQAGGIGEDVMFVHSIRAVDKYAPRSLPTRPHGLTTSGLGSTIRHR